MKEFLENYYSYLTHFIELFAAVTGIVLFSKYKSSTAAKLFIYYLIYVSIVDLLGGYTYFIEDGPLCFLKGSVFEKNKWWFTIFWNIGGVLFFTLYYFKILKNKLFKNLIKWLSVCFATYSVLYIAFHWEFFFRVSFVYINLFGVFLIFVCASFYFIEVLQSNKVLKFYESLSFYVSLAVFVFWLVITPLIFFDRYFTTQDWDYVILKSLIYLFSNLFMYTVFAIGLIVAKPENDA